MNIENRIEFLLNEMTMDNAIRDHLSGTDRKVSKGMMWNMIKQISKNAKRKKFDKVWDNLVRDKFLIKMKGEMFKWEK